MSKFREWYLDNTTEITWFLIGLLTSTGLEALARQDYASSAFSFTLAFINYILNKK